MARSNSMLKKKKLNLHYMQIGEIKIMTKQLNHFSFMIHSSLNSKVLLKPKLPTPYMS